MFVFCRKRTMEVVQLIQKILLVLFTFAFFWKLIRHMWSFLVLNLEKQPIRILITGAAGQIGYAIAPMIARGGMLGPDQPVILHLFDIDQALGALKALQMELIDSCFPLLHDVKISIDVVEASKDVDIAILIGGFRLQEGIERKDVMSKNISIIKAQASTLANHASPNCKVLVVANPANTNATILNELGDSIPTKNISFLSRLDHNRATARLAQKLDVVVTDIKNIIIWGNHSKTQYPDTNHAVVSTPYGSKSPKQLGVNDNWLNADFIESVRDRGDAILNSRKLPSALSAACAACDHIRDWVLGTPKGSWVSMGVCSDGSYGIEPGLFCSFPVTCENGEWSIVKGLKIDDFSRKKINATVAELMEERSLISSLL